MNILDDMLEEVFDDDSKESEAREKLYLQTLMDSAAGRWILRDILNTFEFKLSRKSTGHNSDDSYHRGIQDAVKKYRDMIVRYFGHAGIDTVYKEKA